MLTLQRHEAVSTGHRGATGRPAWSCRIRDADRVWRRGSVGARSYHHAGLSAESPDATPREALIDGWFRTGDLGSIDVSGHLKLIGRLKNMIVTDGGKNIYPEDIEAAFDTCALQKS